MKNKIIIKKLKNGKEYTIRENRDRIFLPSEWIVFYNNLKEKQKVTFNFLINTGARFNEIRGIKVKDVELKNKKIKIINVKKRGIFSDGNPRDIIVSIKFIKFIKSVIKKNNLNRENLFPILSNSAANRAMKKALAESNIEDYKMFSPHSIRKSLESWLVCLDITTLKILKQFGHDQVTANKHYIKLIVMNRLELNKIRHIIGEVFFNDGKIDKLNDKIRKLEMIIDNFINKQNEVKKENSIPKTMQ